MNEKGYLLTKKFGITLETFGLEKELKLAFKMVYPDGSLWKGNFKAREHNTSFEAISYFAHSDTKIQDK